MIEDLRGEPSDEKKEMIIEEQESLEQKGDN